ncbi:hypothetical protein ACI2RL_001111 [Vibrio alginolyticus]
MKQVDVILMYEHVSRELDSLLILKNELNRLGISCLILPIHFSRYWFTVKYRPKVVVLPYLYSCQNKTKRNFENSYDGIVFINLHHEQFYNDDTKEHLLPSDDYSKNVVHLSWSSRFSEDLLEVGVSESTIKILGNPRSDSYFSNVEDELCQLKSKYESIIFVATTFSWALVDESYFLNIDSIDEGEFKRTRKITLEAAKAYFKDFYKLANKFPRKLFVLRPHPFEDISVFKSLFFDVNDTNIVPDNILISRDYNIYQWLKVSDITIGWCTTVNMEAALYNKDNVIYHPTYYPKEMELEFYRYYDIVGSYEVLESIISGEISVQESPSYRNYINESFGVADGKVNLRLAQEIKEIISCNDVGITFKSSFIKNVMKAITIDLAKHFLIKCNLLHKLDNNYAGILEDNLSNKQILQEFERKFPC